MYSVALDDGGSTFDFGLRRSPSVADVVALADDDGQWRANLMGDLGEKVKSHLFMIFHQTIGLDLRA